MKKKLIDYLPPVLKEVEELNNILDVQQSEIYNLKDSVDRMFKDQFIADATEQGLSKWEKIFGIQPKATESELSLIHIFVIACIDLRIKEEKKESKNVKT